METRVEVIAEHPLKGTSQVTNIAYLVYVALGKDGRPTPAPAITYDTDEQHERAELGKARQARRKQDQARE